MASALERAAKAAADLFGPGVSTETGKVIARAVLMAVRDLDDETRRRGSEIYCTKGSGLFTAMIDAILNEKDTTND